MSDLDPSPSASTGEASPSATPTPTACYVGRRERVRVVELLDPVEFDGRTYERIAVRRLTAREVADFIDLMRSDPGAEFRWPMTDAPDAVLDVLDDDDMGAINQAIADFLPLRFRADPVSASSLSAGSATAP